MHNNFIYTKEEHCKGCNKCIFKCPVRANKAVWNNDENIVLIKDGFCISCGECFSICDHNARDFEDDTARFFKDLKNGANISVIAAPSAITNFPNIKKVFGYLKSLGVNLIYDVSYGADICVWGHLRMLEILNLQSMISQPCPVIVSYIEKYHPYILKHLSPIQSPVMCTAIYLKKYNRVTDKIAFLSPCIGKKRECVDENTRGLIDLNVTFSKFLEYIEQNNIHIESYPEYSFDSLDTSLGFAFSRPGGLTENIKFNLDSDVWIKQIEGIHNLEQYIGHYVEDMELGRPVPLIIDVLNCEHGCNVGTGTNKSANFNFIDFKINKAKAKVTKQDSERIMAEFDKNLVLNDFVREYKDKSEKFLFSQPDDLENAYIELGKLTEQDRNINCFSCGYGSCEKFAIALSNQENHKNNCKQYLLNKFKSLSMVDELTGLKNRYSYSISIEKYEKQPLKSLGIIFIDINGLKIANDIKGHKYGDSLILRCANILKGVFPGKIYRVGGDEFVVLDENVAEESFYTKIVKLRDILKADKNILFSIGDYWSVDTTKIKEHIEIADKRMYYEKQQHYKTLNT